MPRRRALVLSTVVSVLLGLVGLAPAAEAATPSVPTEVGDVLVADPQHGIVWRFRADGSPPTTVGLGLRAPHGVAVDPDGNVYIADQPDYIVDPSTQLPDGRLIKVSSDGTTQTVLNTDLYLPWGVVADATHVYVSDFSGVGGVRRMDHVGGGPQWLTTNAIVPAGLALSPSGTLYVADPYAYAIQAVPPGGGSPTAIPAASLPWDVATSSASDVFISEFGGSVTRIPGGSGTPEQFGPDLDAPYGVALDAAGTLLAADPSAGTVRRIAADGSALTDIGAGVFGTDYPAPYDVAVYDPAPVFTSGAPSAGAVGTSYSFTFTASALDGQPDPRFRLVSGSVPGLTLDPATGVLSGTPTTAGDFEIVVQTENAASATIGDPVTITIAEQPITDPPVGFTTTAPVNPPVGSTYTPGAATDPPGGRVVIAASGTCSIVSGVVTFDDPGLCTLTAGSASQAITVVKADTTLDLEITGDVLSASVSVVAPGAGAPGGQVEFAVDGVAVGSAPIGGGAAAVTHAIAPGAAHEVTATYSGSARFEGSSARADRKDPLLTATVTSRRDPVHDWYRTPVTVTFTCEATTAPLVGACPEPITLTKNRRGKRPISVGVVAEDGGAARVDVVVRIDKVAPTVRVRGIKQAVRTDDPSQLRCVARDRLSGVDTCTVRTRVVGDRVRYRAVAVDLAGNRKVVRGRYSLG